MELKLAFAGFGAVARAFARMLYARRAQLEADFGLHWRTTGIATARHGCATSDSGVDLNEAVRVCENGGNLASLPGTKDVSSAGALIESVEANVLFETIPLNPKDGEPAISYITSALDRGVNVVTANKGPVAFAHRRLSDLAKKRNVSFRFEGAVMDGTPIFNLASSCLPAAKVLGFEGVLNSTTNHILAGMECGRTFDECLIEAQRLGIAEANADYDIDGWDAAVKTVALANVLMEADARPADVERQGIRGVTREQLEAAMAGGCAVRLIARGSRDDGSLKLHVAPEAVSLSSPLGSVKGTSNVLILRTDLMGEIAIFESNPGIEQTAYALLSDLLSIYGEM